MTYLYIPLKLNERFRHQYVENVSNEFYYSTITQRFNGGAKGSRWAAPLQGRQFRSTTLLYLASLTIKNKFYKK